MSPHPHHRLTSVIAVALTLAGCGSASIGGVVTGEEVDASQSAPAPGQPARLEAVPGTDLNRVILAPRAAERLAVSTQKVTEVQAPVVEGGPLTRHAVIPMSAVVYDKDGNAWAYTSPRPLTFLREHVQLGRVENGLGHLQAGPIAGTPVVTTGAAELLGVEYGVDGG